ncbi:MAG TPA: glycosyltransferase family 2 protein, partial [Anaerolineae bacterium]|nr:glycosyltransferase family 2 protein [Anaerolineae bacterium]
MNSFSLSVCMPAYNEEANLPGMIADVVAMMQPRFADFEIVVTNDGSKDRTGEVLRELAQQYPQLKPVDHVVNQGYGAAVFTALSNASKDVIFFTDSDRQFKLEEIDLLSP